MKDYRWMHALIAIPCTSSLQGCMHPPKGKRKESAMSEKETEGSTKGKVGLYKKLQIPTLPPKWPRSGVTFHFVNSYFDKVKFSSRSATLK